jgi:hypothetical protein
MAVPEEEILKVNIDIPSAGILVLGLIAKLKPYYAAMVALPGIPHDSIYELEGYARAMIHAHTQAGWAGTPIPPITMLIERGTEGRDLLKKSADYHAAFGPIDRARLGKVQGGNSHRDLALDLFGLVSLHREAWAAISAKSQFGVELLDELETLAGQIMVTIGERQQVDVSALEASQIRSRAFTLFSNSYDQVQRCIYFLRWGKSDADQLAPSLYGGPTRRSKPDGTTEPAPPAGGGKGGTAPQSATAASTSEGSPNDGTEPGGPYAKG